MNVGGKLQNRLTSRFENLRKPLIRLILILNDFSDYKNNHRCRKQTYGYQGGTWGRDKLGDWD